jgi:alanine dehydrogenase
VTAIPVLGYEAVMRAVTPAEAIERVRDAFVRYEHGEWHMPPKVYLPSPPHGDFRAMPAGNDELALLKWVTSFPGNVTRALPVVTGVICLSDATTGMIKMLLDARSVTALRTGAAAAVATRALARDQAMTVGIIGCGVHGSWAARCLHTDGYGPGVCADVNASAATALASELGWRAGSVDEARAQDVVCTITPGATPVITADALVAGQHLNLLGADGPGKAEATVEAVRACALFCDDWSQASHGGELANAFAAGLISRADVTDLGDVLTGVAAGRTDERQITLFDSTGLAIQDLAIAAAALARYEAGDITAQTVEL